MKRKVNQSYIIDCLNTKYGQALLLTSDGGEDRLQMYKHFMDMFEANGVLDIAFKTDERLVYE